MIKRFKYLIQIFSPVTETDGSGDGFDPRKIYFVQAEVENCHTKIEVVALPTHTVQCNEKSSHLQLRQLRFSASRLLIRCMLHLRRDVKKQTCYVWTVKLDKCQLFEQMMASSLHVPI